MSYNINMSYIIKHKQTKEEGVAYIISNDKIRIFYGADDGSDDKTISKQEFNNEWDIIEKAPE